MARTRPSESGEASTSLQCRDCHSLSPQDAPYCEACGGRLAARKKSRVAHGAIAAYLGIGAVILYWIGYK
jgi:uncharacterized paraquat-inducible protein A